MNEIAAGMEFLGDTLCPVALLGFVSHIISYTMACNERKVLLQSLTMSLPIIDASCIMRFPNACRNFAH
eukprot:2967164-Amphidinium_carterae.1